jgi:hypothetical protein
MGIWHSPTIKQERNKVLEINIRLGDGQFVFELTATQYFPRDKAVPMEERPTAAF